MYISLKELNKLNNMKTELMQIKEQKILAKVYNFTVPL